MPHQAQSQELDRGCTGSIRILVQQLGARSLPAQCLGLCLPIQTISQRGTGSACAPGRAAAGGICAAHLKCSSHLRQESAQSDSSIMRQQSLVGNIQGCISGKNSLQQSSLHNIQSADMLSIGICKRVAPRMCVLREHRANKDHTLTLFSVQGCASSRTHLLQHH